MTAAANPIRAARVRRTLLISSALVGGVLLTTPGMAQNLPTVSGQTGGTFTSGGATFTYDAATVPASTTLQVNLNNANRILDFTGFDVNTGRTVTFVDGVAGTPALSVLNRINSAGASLINGAIISDSNISVWLVNPQGVTFGAGGSFSGGSLLVSTMPLDAGQEAAFLAAGVAQPRFTGTSTGAITFTGGSGRIQALAGSIVAVAQNITAGKIMEATGGSVALVAGTDVVFTSGVGSPLDFEVRAGTTIGTAAVNVTGNLTGQSIRLAGGAQVALNAALLNVGAGTELTATATGGSIVLATATTAANDVRITNAATRTPAVTSAGRLIAAGLNSDVIVSSIGAVNLSGTISAQRDLSILGAGLVNLGGATDTGRNVTITGGGAVTVSGGIEAIGNYTVSGFAGAGNAAVTLGDTLNPVNQTAGGSVTIAANSGNIVGVGSLLLQSNSDGAGADAMLLDANSLAGVVDFAGTTTLLGGTSGAGGQLADIFVDSKDTLTLGAVNAQSLKTQGEATALISSGLITLGNVTVADTLDVQSTGVLSGGIIAGTLVSADEIALTTAAGDIEFGTANAVNAITVQSQDSIRLASAESTAGNIALTATTGDISGVAGTTDGPLTGYTRAALTAGSDSAIITVTALSGTAQLGILTAGATTLNTVAGANQIDVQTSAYDVNEATAFNGAISFTAAAGDGRVGTLNAGSATSDGDVFVSAQGKVVVDGPVVAFGNVTVNGSTGTAEVSGNVDARKGNYAVSGLAGAGNAAVTLGASGSVEQKASGTVTITANSGNIVGTGALILQSNSDGTGADAMLLDANSAAGVVNFAGTTSLRGGTTGVGGQLADIFVNSQNRLTLGAVTAQGLTTQGQTALISSGLITLGNVTVADTLDMRSNSVVSGGIIAGNLVSADEIALTTANGDIELGTANAVNDIIIQSQGSIRLASAESTAGNIGLTATTGDISGIAGTTSGPLTGFTRADLTAGSNGATINVTALSGTAQLGDLTAGATSLNMGMGNQIYVQAGAFDLNEATAFNGDITLTAATGDGRAGIVTAGSDSATITVAALSGTAQLGILTAGATSLNTVVGNQIDVQASAFDVDEATAINGSLSLSASAGNGRAGTLNAGSATSDGDAFVSAQGDVLVDGPVVAFGNVTVTGSTGTAEVSGNVNARKGNYAVSGTALTGTAVTLGSSGSAEQKASGTVTITASSGNIVGTGALILQSNSDGTGADAMLLDANSLAGVVNFASTTSLLGGTTGVGGELADIFVDSKNTLTLGDVTARSLRTQGQATDLTATGTIALGTVILDQSFNAVTTAGSITATAVTVGGANQILRLSAGGATSDIGISGSLRTNGSDILLTAGRDVTASALTILSGTAATTGTVALLAGRNIDAGTLSAGEDVAARAGAIGTARFASIIARDDVSLQSGGAMTLGSVTITGGGANGRQPLLNLALAGLPASISFDVAAQPAGSFLSITAPSLTGLVAMDGSTDTGLVIRDLEGASFDLDAGGDAHLGSLTATSGDIDIDANGSVTGLRASTPWVAYSSGGPTISVGNAAVTLDGTDTAGAFEIGSITAGDVSTIGTPGSVRIGTATVNALSLTAGSNLQIDGGTVLNTVILATTTGTPGAFSLTNPSLVADYGRASLTTQSSGTRIAVDAGAAAQLGDLTAGIADNTTIVGEQIHVSAAALDILTATARNGELSLFASDGRLTLGTGIAATRALLAKDDDSLLNLPTNILEVTNTVTGGTGVAIRSRTSASIANALASTGNLTIDATNNASLSGVGEATSGSILFLTGNDFSAATLTAGEDIFGRTGGSITIGSATAADNINLFADGGLTLTTGTALSGGGADDLSYAFDLARAGFGDGITAAVPTVVNGDIDLTGANVRLGTVTTNATNAPSAVGNIRVTATATDVSGLVDVSNTSGLVPGFGRGDLIAGGGLGRITVQAATGSIQLGTVQAGVTGATELTGAGQVAMTARAIDANSVDARNGSARLLATATDARVGTVAALRDIVLDAARDVTISTTGTTTAGTLFALSGGDFTAGTLNAGEDIAARSGGAMTIGSATAADVINLFADGRLTLTTGTTLSSGGADDLSYGFDLARAGFGDGITTAVATVANGDIDLTGSDVRLGTVTTNATNASTVVGNIRVIATATDVSGLVDVSNTSGLVPGFGRGDLIAGGGLGRITVQAATGSIQLGTVQAGVTGATELTGARQVAMTARAIDANSVDARNGSAGLLATATDARVDTIAAFRDVVLDALRDVTISTSGATRSGSLFALAGRNILAGSLTAGEDILGRSGGTTTISSATSADNIDLLADGSLVLTSGETLGTGGNDDFRYVLTVARAGIGDGIVTGAATALNGDISLSGSDVRLGTVTTNATNASTAVGNIRITATTTDVSGLVDVSNTSGLVPGFGRGDLIAGGGLGRISVQAATGSIQLGTVQAGVTGATELTGAGQVAMKARAIDANSVDARNGSARLLATATDARVGTIAALRDIVLDTARDVTVSTTGTTTAGTLFALSGGDFTAGTLNAGEDIAARAGGAMTIGSATAADVINLFADGRLTLTTGTTLSSGGTDDLSYAFDLARAGFGDGITTAAATVANGDIDLTGANVRLGTVTTNAANASTVVGNIRVTATATDVSGLVDATSAGPLLPGFGRGSLFAKGAQGRISIQALTGAIQLDAVEAGVTGATGVTGSPQVTITGLAIDVNSVVAKNGSARLFATDPALTASTDVRANDVTASQDVLIFANRDVLLGTGTATTGTLAIKAGRDMIGVGSSAMTIAGASVEPGATLTAGKDVAISAGRNAALASVTAGDDIDVSATARAAIGTATGTGAGLDDSRVLFAANDITISTASGDIAAQSGKTIGVNADTVLATALVTGTTGDIRINALSLASIVDATAGTGGQGTLAIRSGGIVRSTGALTAAEDLSIGAGTDATLNTLTAGDDIDILAGGTVVLTQATTTGLGAGSRFADLTTGVVGTASGIAINSGEDSALAGSNIRIRAAALNPSTVAEAGLLVGTLQGRSFDLVADAGDIRIAKLDASGGNIDIAATQGSVTGRGTVDTIGGSRLTTPGRVIIGVTGNAAIDTITSGTVETQGTGSSLRIGTVDTDVLTASAVNTLEIGGGIVSGAVSLRTTGGTAATHSVTATPLATGYGAANLSANSANALIDVTAGRVAQLGTVEAGAGTGTLNAAQITVSAAAVDVSSATTRNGALSLLATAGRLGLGTGSVATKADLVKRSATGDLTIAQSLTTTGDILLESQGNIEISGPVTATNADAIITARNAGTGSTVIGEGVSGVTDASFTLGEAEVNRLNARTVKIDSVAQNVTIGKLAIDDTTGVDRLALLTTGAIRLGAEISGSGTGVLQIGGSGTTALPADAAIDPTALASQIGANIGSSGTVAKITFTNGVVDLRAKRIVFARDNLVSKYLGNNVSLTTVQQDVAFSGSELYLADGTARSFLEAKQLRVGYSDFALFQNTGGPTGAGVILNRQSTPSVADIALQLYSSGDSAGNAFILFGTINGFIGRSAGILPNGNIEIAAPNSNPRLVRITQANSRINGCVIGSPDKGCLITDPPRPNFSIYDERQVQLFGAADEASLFVNPLIGRGNEGLIVEIADTPIGIDTLECPADDPNCAAKGERK